MAVEAFRNSEFPDAPEALISIYEKIRLIPYDSIGYMIFRYKLNTNIPVKKIPQHSGADAEHYFSKLQDEYPSIKVLKS